MASFASLCQWRACRARPHREIAAFDALAFFRDLGLEEHLSPNRRNGFYTMAQKIRSLAKDEPTDL